MSKRMVQVNLLAFSVFSLILVGMICTHKQKMKELDVRFVEAKILSHEEITASGEKEKPFWARNKW